MEDQEMLVTYLRCRGPDTSLEWSRMLRLVLSLTLCMLSMMHDQKPDD